MSSSGDVRNDDGVWRRSMSLNEAGDLVIEGHDLGRGVESGWGLGLREYEFVRTVRAADLPALRRVLELPGTSNPDGSPIGDPQMKAFPDRR